MRKTLYSLVVLFLLILALPPSLQAQQRTITGTILSDDDKTPLQGVTVKVRGTNRITQTDANGKFSIQVNAGETLELSHVGYETQTVKAGSGNSIGISLKKSDNTMGEVVVTAMDIKRNSRELGYSAQKVSGKDIAETQRENFLNSLQGRVAGLTVTPTTGQAGASSQITLRGFNSLSLSNSPLFVLDGIILDNSTFNETSNGGSAIGLASDRPNRNNDYTNRIADINPNDIESITVLKGPEATALYGSQASSGAIVITTRKAVTGKTSISYDNSFRVTGVNRTNDVNNEFGFGSSGVPSSTFTATSGSYFGPRYPAGTKRYDNIDAFFRTGFSQTHNLSADLGFKDVGFKVTGSYFNQQGVIPGNEFKKYNIRVTNTTKIGKMIEITPSFQYINSTNDKPLRSVGGYLLSLYVWPDNNDIRRFSDANGDKVSIFSTDPYGELDNPLYSVNKNHSQDKTKRYVFSGGINFTPFSWLTFAGRFGYDTYNQDGYTFYHPLSNLSSKSALGSLDNYYLKYTGYNHTITATATKKFGKFTARLMAGTMWQDYETKIFAIYGTNLVDSIGSASNPSGYNKLYKNGQIVTDANFNQLVGSPTDSNITRPNTRIRLLRNAFGEYNESIIRELAYFGEASISYNNVIFLSYTHRFESASVFIQNLRDYNYPGFSLSAIVSDMIPGLKGNKILSFLKLRASRASTARLPPPYFNQSVFVNSLTSSNVGQTYNYGFDNNNPNLGPERQRTYELGGELRLFNNLIGLDVSYYNTLCIDQINKQYRASYATGFVLNTGNVGTSRNQGVEVVTDLNLVRKKDVSWNMRLNFNHTWSQVVSLPLSIQSEYYNSDTWLYANARGGVHLGGTTTTISGFHYARNLAGQILISPTTGLPQVEQTYTQIGDRNPHYTIGFTNNIRYKNWTLSFLWDLKVGGDIYNATDQYLTVQGKSPRTADRETPRIIQGVLADGLQNTTTPTPNTIVITPYYQTAYYTSMPEEEFIQHDVNWFRLRDLTLGYTLPDRMLKRMKFFKSLGFFITGNDLILMTNYRGADPSSNGNTAASLGVGAWGFDYGNLPTPRSLNFGLKATFR